MQWLMRMVNAARGGGKRPVIGQMIRPRREDQLREYPADGLTPQRLVSVFRAADSGDAASMMALFEQMEEKDAHLFSVANTRRLAVTGLPWEIVSAAQMPGWGIGRFRSAAEAERADAAAEYCDRVLREAEGFEEALSHLSLALGRNLALVEIVWEAGSEGIAPREFVPVDFARLTIGEQGEVRILMEENSTEGAALAEQKFIVHSPHAASGHPMRGGLLRVTALAYLGKHFAIKDWLIFAEVFGMPVRIGRYNPNATPEEKRELLDMLRQLGADATGVFSKAVEIQVQQTRLPGETNLYENLCLYFDREISKAWLGQTLTTDTARMLASAGAAEVHDRVRHDLRDDDLRKEARTIRRDLLGPMVRLQFGERTPTPYFRRVTDQRFAPELMGRVLSIAVNELGARVPARWAHAALNLPEARGDEAVLPGAMGGSKSGA